MMAEANQSLNERRTARDQLQHNMEPERLAQVSTAAFASILELQAQLLRTWSDGLMVWAQSIDANMRTHRDRAT